MIRVRLQIGDGAILDTYKEYGLIYMDADERTEAPIKGRDTTSYAETAGEHIDPRTVQDAFDYTVKFLIEAINKDMRNANKRIADFNKALYTQMTGSDIRTFREVTFYNDYNRVKIVGYPEPISEPLDFYRRQDGSAMDCVEVDLKIRVSDPTKCDFNLFLGDGNNLLRHTNQGTRGWSANGSTNGTMVIDSEQMGDALGIVANNLSPVASPDWQILMFDIPYDTFEAGKRYVLSFDASTGTSGVTMLVVPQKSTGGPSWLTTERLSVALQTTMTHHVLHFTGAGPGDSDVRYYLCFTIVQGIRWDTIRVCNVKLEAGDVATEWSASPDDIDYNPQG